MCFSPHAAHSSPVGLIFSSCFAALGILLISCSHPRRARFPSWCFRFLLLLQELCKPAPVMPRRCVRSQCCSALLWECLKPSTAALKHSTSGMLSSCEKPSHFLARRFPMQGFCKEQGRKQQEPPWSQKEEEKAGVRSSDTAPQTRPVERLLAHVAYALPLPHGLGELSFLEQRQHSAVI